MAAKRGPDAGLRTVIRDSLGKPDWDWRAIETGATSAGLPDAVGLHRPSDTVVWVESKKSDHWAVKFEPHQLGWWRLWGGAVRGLIAVRALGAAATGGKGDGLYLYPANAVPALDAAGLRTEPLLKCYGPPRTWDWRAVERALVGGENQ